MASIFSKLMISFFLISILLFTQGCSSNNSNANLQQLGGFLGGDNGLVIKVIAGAPPSVIQDNSLTPFSFVLTLENAGEAKVGVGTDNPLILTRLVGIVNNNFGLTPESATRKIDGPLEQARRNIDGSITPGEITDVMFDNLVYKPRVADTISLPIRAEVCYDYESYATTKFCMKKDTIESAEDSTICMLKGPRPLGNSGAPIHVTAVEQSPVNDKTIQLNIKIEHVGNGIYFYRNEPKDNYDACVFSDLNPHIYKMEIFVEPVLKDAYSVDCLRLDETLTGGGVKGIIKSHSNAPIVLTCFVTRIKPMEQRVYEDLMNIKMRYRYGEFLEVPILIQGHP